MNIKNEINESRAKVRKLKNQLSNCHSPELREHLEYQLRQEAIKLEGFLLLQDLAKKVGEADGKKDLF